MRHVPLEELSQKTKINLKTLKALEMDDFSELPGFVFAKGYVRTYARTIGINEEEAMVQCEDYLRTVLREDPEKKQRVRWLVPRVKVRPWVFVWLLLAFLIVFAYFRS